MSVICICSTGWLLWPSSTGFVFSISVCLCVMCMGVVCQTSHTQMFDAEQITNGKMENGRTNRTGWRECGDKNSNKKRSQKWERRNEEIYVWENWLVARAMLTMLKHSVRISVFCFSNGWLVYSWYPWRVLLDLNSCCVCRNIRVLIIIFLFLTFSSLSFFSPPHSSFIVFYRRNENELIANSKTKREILTKNQFFIQTFTEVLTTKTKTKTK